jgi:hypothetical protein
MTSVNGADTSSKLSVLQAEEELERFKVNRQTL